MVGKTSETGGTVFHHFQRQIAVMIRRRAWPEKSGRQKQRTACADQLDLPIQHQESWFVPGFRYP